MSAIIASATELREHPRNLRPHVVLLGAGASLAAFLHGDATGRRLPLMPNFVEIVGLKPFLSELPAGLAEEPNIEVLYPRLLAQTEWLPIARAVEEAIRAYFSALTLPDTATLYDRLVLSLRPADAVITFNWDPFLSDALRRNAGIVPLPQAFYLHGSVRLAVCRDHPQAMGNPGGTCSMCGKALAAAPLLYPVERKDYSSDPTTVHQWERARAILADAMCLTIFGYGAPASDVEAVALLRDAWFQRADRKMEHVELIDIALRDELERRWTPFTPTRHLHPVTSFEQSHLAKWPRRVADSWAIPMSEGRPCEVFPLPTTDALGELQAFCKDLAQFEAKETGDTATG